MAAIWSKVGRLERERREGPVEMDWKATGTGLVVEQRTVLETNEVGKASEDVRRVRRASVVMACFPRIKEPLIPPERKVGLRSWEVGNGGLTTDMRPS